MSFLDQLTPVNLQEEKRKFFADFSYNPQFVYAELIDQKKLLKHPRPTTELLDLAKKIAEKELEKQSEATLEQQLGRVLTHEEVTQKAQLFLKMHNLDKQVDIIWSASFVSRATMSLKALKLKTTAEFREKETVGMLYHEIGTHGLRNYNYQRQPWYRKKKQFNLYGEYLETEEGLAVVHSLMPVENKLLTKCAVRYLASDKTLTLSFSQLWQFLESYIDDEEERWTAVVRQKRGITDTAQPGAYMKDAVYFSGAILMLRWLKQNDFRLEELYLGKISVNDLETVVQIQGNLPSALPSFYTLDKEKYTATVTEIAVANTIF